MKTGNILLLSVLAVLTIMAIVDMPANIDTIEYLRNELPDKNQFEIDFIRPHALILKIIFDILKIFALIVGLLFTFKWTNRPRLTFFSLLLMVLTFLYFDLPIHKCYNGNLETYWELGRHFH